MASILISRRIIAGFKHFLAPSRELTRIQKLQAPLLNLSIVRSAQRAVEFAPQAAQKLDRVLYRIDSEIRRTGRISKKEIDDVFGELKYLKYASSTQSLLLLRCLGSLLTEELPEVRNKLVQEIWDTLIKFNIPLDISHYNTLLRVYIENERQFAPFEFLSSLEKAGIEPNRVTYQRLITRYCHEGDIDGASKILEFMKEKELPVNENVFNSLVLGHARADDLESAHGVLTVMKASGLTPSQATYMNLMIGYAEKGDIEGLEKVMKECESSDIQLQNHEYMEVIYALAAKGHSQHVSLFIEKLEKVYGYQQDAMNLIYRLINAGCDEVAYQMFETMALPQNSEGETTPVGTFFLKQLIKSELYSLVTIVQYCQKMKREGLNMYALERSLQFALSVGRPELAVAIMKVIMEDGAPVRSHYFWPVIIHFANQGDKEKLCKTVADMAQMEVPISLETCRDYIIPGLLEKDKDEEPVILALKDCGMTVPSIVNGCVAYYLGENDIVSAAQLLSRYKVKITNILRRDLADAYIRTKEATAAASVMRQMVNDTRKEEASTENVEAGEEDQDDVATERNVQDVGGMFLMDVVMMTRSGVPLLEPVLLAMKTLGISISKDSANAVQSRLGEHLTESIVDMLDELASGDLTLQPLSRDVKPLAHHSIEELEHRVTELEIKNLPHTYVLSQLFTSYARMRNIEKAEEVKQKLDALEFPFPVGHNVLLIDMYVSEGQLEKALDIYRDIRSKEPDLKINSSKVLRLAGAMISEGMLEETVKLIEENGPESSEMKDDPGASFACTKFLNNAIGNASVTPAVVQRLFDTLVQQNYSKVVPALCGPLIRVHLATDDLASAMEAFEKISEEHRVTPMKHELTLACIKLEDTEKLQKIMDKSINVHGEVNSLYDLVFAFIECGKVRQAKKILETPGLRARPQRLDSRCKRLLEDDRITELEHLVTITKDVFDVDRNMMFMHLFEAYKRLDDCDKAIGIWTTMQEENIEPSESFLWELGQFLKKHGRDVPFAMPKPLSSPPQTQTVRAPPVPALNLASQVEASGISKSPFIQALRRKNFDAALQARTSLEKSGVQLTITDNSKLIEGLVQEGKLEDATKIAREMAVTGQHPMPRVFKFLLNRLSSNGKIEEISFFDKYLDENVKRSLQYNNRLGNAYMNAGRGEEFLDSISSLVDVPDVDVAQVKSKIPAGGIMGILQNNEELLPKVMSIAEKFTSLGISTLANCIWMHQFAEGNFAEAKEVYDKHLANSGDNLMFANINHKARATSNPELLPQLLEVLNSRPSTPAAAKGIVYSCWLDVLCANQKYDEALGVLEASLEKIELQDFNSTALLRVKEGLASSNKTFPYTIPQKAKQNQQSSSSSSSSSDSDRKA